MSLDLDTEGQAKVHQVRRAWEKGTEELEAGICGEVGMVRVFLVCQPRSFFTTLLGTLQETD